VPCGRARCLFRIHALVGKARLSEPVLLASPLQELPHPARFGAGHGAWQEAGFGLRQMNQLRRQTFLIQDAANQQPIPSGPLQSRDQSLATVIGKVVDVAQNCVINRQWELGDSRCHLVTNLVLEPRIHWERHLQDVFQGGFLKTGYFARGPGAKSTEVVAVNRIHHLFQAMLVCLTVRRIVIRSLEHQIDGGVEFAAGALQILALVTSLRDPQMLLGTTHDAIGTSAERRDRVGGNEHGSFVEVQVRLNDRGFGDFCCRHRCRGQEGHLEPGVLTSTASASQNDQQEDDG